MRLLVIGYSKLFKNRLIPVLNQLTEIKEIHIAKFKDQNWDREYKRLICPKVYLHKSYEEAEDINVDIAYISSINSDHFYSAKKCLEQNIHTIIDKPAVLSFSEFDTLNKISLKKNVLLAESTVYTYHPQFKKIKDIIQKPKNNIHTINAIFSMPPFENTNFRYKKELGGGAINDLGPYVVSLGRYFFGEQPENIICSIKEKNEEVDISFDIILKYSKNRSVIGHFGFTSEYINSMTLLGNNIKLSVQPVFTVPDTLNTMINITSKNNEKIEISNKSNSFYLFFKDILNTIKYNKDFDRFRKIMETDCKTLDLLRSKI